LKNIIINATAAKTGGAETIIKTFINSLPKKNTGVRYVVLSSIKDLDISQNKNLLIAKKETNHLGTLWFSLIGIIYYQLKYRTLRVVSFNNINSLISYKWGITYFHQLKVFIPEHFDVKVRVYSFLIRNLLFKNTFIIQSSYVERLFKDKFPNHQGNIISSWPGFIIPKKIKLKNNTKNSKSFIGIVPIAYNAPHKNINLIFELKSFFEKKQIKITTLLDKPLVIDNEDTVFSYIGVQNKEDLFQLYNESGFMLFPSKAETIGLPIFEFLQTGKPAFVFAAEYAISLYEQFGRPENFILFKDVEEFKSLFSQKINTTAKPFDYSKGEWHKILDLL
jgi:glycosyltransferase involved in cell wall biosynthesis